MLPSRGRVHLTHLSPAPTASAYWPALALYSQQVAAISRQSPSDARNLGREGQQRAAQKDTPEPGSERIRLSQITSEISISS